MDESIDWSEWTHVGGLMGGGLGEWMNESINGIAGWMDARMDEWVDR